jgi:hypothetical protein
LIVAASSCVIVVSSFAQHITHTPLCPTPHHHFDHSICLAFIVKQQAYLHFIVTINPTYWLVVVFGHPTKYRSQEFGCPSLIFGLGLKKTGIFWHERSANKKQTSCLGFECKASGNQGT